MARNLHLWSFGKGQIGDTERGFWAQAGTLNNSARQCSGRS